MKPDLSKIPPNPGCYFFKNSSGKIIYIGKAKNLRKRVKSYFQKNDHDTKTSILITHIYDIDFLVTDTEVEALILENNLIKKHKPKYNIDLKDSKKYAYIKIIDEEFPRLVTARKIDENEKGIYFGPFTSGTNRDHILYLMKRIFRLRTCKKLPKRTCLRHHIGLCDAPCVNLISKEDYDENIKAIKLVLSGKIGKLIRSLKKQMKNDSKEKNYEKALIIRDQITALHDLLERQKMQREKKYNEDIINFKVKDDMVYLMLFNVSQGTILNKQEFTFDYTLDFFEEFLLQYYSNNDIPKVLILPEDISDSLKKYLHKMRGWKMIFDVPKIGEKKQLLELILKNIDLTFFTDLKQLEELKSHLNLAKPPFVIECFDVSHLGGTNLVASMIQFRNAVPDKTNYRRFKVKSFEGNDDTRAMKEVVFRRYYKLKKESLKFPDLIVIDGGKGQLSSALGALRELEVKIPIISLAKRDEEIFVPGNPDPIKLSKKNEGLKLLQKIRDEAHRFANSYNRLLRVKMVRE